MGRFLFAAWSSSPALLLADHVAFCAIQLLSSVALKRLQVCAIGTTGNNGIDLAGCLPLSEGTA